MTKLKIIALTALTLTVAGAVIFGLGGGFGRRPFASLSAEEISSARVECLPPDASAEIEDREALAALLRGCVVYQKDAGWTEYTGQAVRFTLTMRDGSELVVMEYSPFLVINGEGYRCKNASCEALSGFGNAAVNKNA